jgi:hypothetical protein
MKKKRTWIWILLGALAVIAVGCFAVIGTGLYLASRQVNVIETEASDANTRFEAVRARFKGQDPLLGVGPDGERTAAALERRLAEYTGPPPSTLHVLAWNDHEKKLVELSVPFWLFRLASTDTSRWHFNDFEFERLGVEPADLERAGPSLVLDETKDRARVMLWTE